jgi:hypothetical protein
MTWQDIGRKQGRGRTLDSPGGAGDEGWGLREGQSRAGAGGTVWPAQGSSPGEGLTLP